MADDDRPFYPTASTLKAAAAPINRPRRARKSTLKATDYGSEDEDGRPTRPVRLSLRNSRNQHQDSHPRGPGDETRIGWDRELDSDDEPLAVEEHFILRVPPTVAPQLTEQLANKAVGPDVWFKFVDSRRALFHAGETTYRAKLVDLPTLTESQRLTGNGGQTIKVADIHQMLVVEDPIEDETRLTADRGFNIEDFIYPHGITPPLQHVRKRRFRKRVNNRTIEVVEQAVEKLLEADSNAQQSNYGNLTPSLTVFVRPPDSPLPCTCLTRHSTPAEILNYELASEDEDAGRGYEQAGPASDEEDTGAPTPRQAGDHTSVHGGEDGPAGQPDDDDSDSDSDEEGSGYDEDLAAEINAGLQGMKESDDEDDSDEGLFGGEDDDEDDDEEEEDDPETVEQKKRIKLLAGEIADLEKAITTKESEIAKQTNPIFKVNHVPHTLPPCPRPRPALTYFFTPYRNVSRTSSRRLPPTAMPSVPSMPPPSASSTRRRSSRPPPPTRPRQRPSQPRRASTRTPSHRWPAGLTSPIFPLQLISAKDPTCTSSRRRRRPRPRSTCRSTMSTSTCRWARPIWT